MLLGITESSFEKNKIAIKKRIGIVTTVFRSEERRVGKELRSRWWPDH